MIERLESAAGRPVSRETVEKLEIYIFRLREEARKQSLVSLKSLDDVWERHVVDSLQLLRFEPTAGSSWVDIGSGAGLPGIVIACASDKHVTLIEPRRLRAEFLIGVVKELSLECTVVQSIAERVRDKFAVITGRAVAPLGRFLGLSYHLSTENTRWVLPKGRNAQSEMLEARSTWQGSFHVERSVTDVNAEIVICTDVRPRPQ